MKLNAIKFRQNKGIGPGTNITTNMLDAFMEQYHKAKLAEITEEEIIDMLIVSSTRQPDTQHRVLIEGKFKRIAKAIISKLK